MGQSKSPSKAQISTSKSKGTKGRFCKRVVLAHVPWFRFFCTVVPFFVPSFRLFGALDGRNRAIVFAESLARDNTAIRIY